MSPLRQAAGDFSPGKVHKKTSEETQRRSWSQLYSLHVVLRLLPMSSIQQWPPVPTAAAPAAALAHTAACAAVRVPKGTSNGVLFVCVPEMEVINIKYVKGSCQEFSPELHS